jgi:cell division protein ZapA
MDRSAARVISVEINGQRYSLRTHLDPEYVARLAAFVDERIRTAAQETLSGDLVKVAVLAALNIADEYFRCREATASDSGSLRARTEALERLVDLALTDTGYPPADRR